MSEERLVGWLQSAARRGARQIGAARRGAGHQRASEIGDDTAILKPSRNRLVVTVDQQIEGVHFPAGLDPGVIARRLLAVNLSDLAASGASPRHAFLALAAPPSFAHRRFFAALFAAARGFGVEVSGGDLSMALRLHLSLTLLGEKGVREASLGRNRARPGHRIWIGGSLGEAALGQRLVALGARPRGSALLLPPSLSVKGELRRAAVRAVWRHLLPTPQLELGRWLARLGPRRAGGAIDVSDGFAKDLHRLCAASGAGARIDVRALHGPAPTPFTELCRTLNEEPGDLVASGGEDYVLLFTLPKAISPPRHYGCRAIGVVTRERAVRIVDARGRARRLRPSGWDHLARRAATIPT